MNQKENIVSAVISIVLGLLLITLKGEIISIVITVFGVAILVSAVVDFMAKLTNIAIVKAVAGICVLVFGWLFVNLALYILAAGIILMGLLQISGINKYAPVNITAGEKFMIYLRPVVTVIAGACLLFNQSGAIEWVFIATGLLLIVQGILALIGTRSM